MSVQRICSIDGCHNQYIARRLCKHHYNLLWNRGSPYAIPSRGNNSLINRFIENVVMKYEGDLCLIWPFKRTSFGYPLMGNKIASRIICERLHGPDNSKRHAAHSCGKGRMGCVTKRHISWKTALENSQDMDAHGTRATGFKLPQTKLSTYDVARIRDLIGTTTNRDIARRFGVSPSIITKISKDPSYRLSTPAEP